jgi:DNA repair metallo-beta-lactamase
VRAAPVDVLYMDNTFCHPCYDHPPRAVALMHLRAAVATHTRTGDERMLLGIDTLGKEELLQEVAAALDCKVAVTEARLQCARAMGLQTSHLTTCWHEARIVTVPRWRVTPKGVATLQARQIQDGDVPFTAALVPTGWARHVESTGRVSISRDGATMPAVTIVSVPYSLHASFTELRRLVEAVRPRVLIGVVASARFADAPIDPVLHFGHLLRHDSPRRALQPLVEKSARGEAPPRASTPHMPAGNARAAKDAVQFPGTRSLLTLSPAAMLACMQRAAGKAAQAVLSTARKRAACVLVMTPGAAAPLNVGDAPDEKVKLEEGLENKPDETHEENAVKRTRTE